MTDTDFHSEAGDILYPYIGLGVDYGTDEEIWVYLSGIFNEYIFSE